MSLQIPISLYQGASMGVPSLVVVVPPENLLEMQILGLHQKVAESESVRMKPSNCVTESSQDTILSDQLPKEHILLSLSTLQISVPIE